jgi:hypothetical protein
MNFLTVFFVDDELGEKVEEEEPRVPIHVVTKASQLPVDFLEPSPHSKIVIGFDCEAVDLCRDGALCIIQVSEFNFFFLCFSYSNSYMKCFKLCSHYSDISLIEI